MIRSDGTHERDYLYVEDAVEAYLAIWDLLEDGRGAGEAFNAGGRRPHSVLEVARACRARSRAPASNRTSAGRAPRPARSTRQWVDSTKLRAMSGWEPRVSLEEGLARTVEWYRRLPPAARRRARAISTGPLGHAASLNRQMRDRLTVTPAQYRLVAYVTLGALTLIVLTGAAVRLTDSGLGCSNWPKCGGSPLPPLSTHALIEFGNRAISGVVGVLTDRRRGPGVHPQAVSPRPRVARLQPAAVRARAGGARRVHGARAPRARVRDGALRAVDDRFDRGRRARLAQRPRTGVAAAVQRPGVGLVDSGAGAAGSADDLRGDRGDRRRAARRRLAGPADPPPALQGRRHA